MISWTLPALSLGVSSLQRQPLLTATSHELPTPETQIDLAMDLIHARLCLCPRILHLARRRPPSGDVRYAGPPLVQAATPVVTAHPETVMRHSPRAPIARFSASSTETPSATNV